MRLAVKLAAAGMLAGIAGVVSAHLAMGSRAEPAALGDPSWQVWRAGEAGDDPYVVARFLMAGRLPPARGQASEFEAEGDSEGRPFEAGCVYSLGLKSAGWHWWSLSVPGGGAIASDTAIAGPDGTVRIAVAASPRPGNWLATPGGSFRLILRIHTSGSTVTPPPAERQACT